MSKKKITTKELCVIAMLLAITVVLSYISGYLRIGTAIKFSISFISVYVAAALYGKWAGGFVGAAADLISCIGMFAPNIYVTLLEFLYGFLFGVFFFRKKRSSLVFRVLIYTAIRTICDITIKTQVIINIDKLNIFNFDWEKFSVLALTRLPACVIMMGIMILAILIFELYFIKSFKKMIKE